jgi:hypothetical protein
MRRHPFLVDLAFIFHLSLTRRLPSLAGLVLKTVPAYAGFDMSRHHASAANSNFLNNTCNQVRPGV